MLSEAIYASVPYLGTLDLAYFGIVSAFMTTVKAARYRKFSLKEAVESLFLSYCWAGSELDLSPFDPIFYFDGRPLF